MLTEYLQQNPVLVMGLAALVAYLIGSIPTAYLACKARGVDIRTVGSGNVGATNAARVLGKAWGIAILLLDALKGFIPVIAVYILFPPKEAALNLMMLSGLAAILGHVFPVWLSFKGGKGVATGLGVMLALVPELTGFAALVFLLTVGITRYVSLGSILGAVSLLIFFLLFYAPKENPLLFGYLALVAAFVIYKHRANMKRLLEGTESKLGSKIEVKK